MFAYKLIELMYKQCFGSLEVKKASWSPEIELLSMLGKLPHFYKESGRTKGQSQALGRSAAVGLRTLVRWQHCRC